MVADEHIIESQLEINSPLNGLKSF
jgi:hypothetical protein